MKAVGVLFGYLGFSNFIFFINPKDGGAWEDAYYLINAVLQSSQVTKQFFLFFASYLKLYFRSIASRILGYRRFFLFSIFHSFF